MTASRPAGVNAVQVGSICGGVHFRAGSQSGAVRLSPLRVFLAALPVSRMETADR
jgi:hypothetical protein